jgi:hypothetical protein
VRNLITEGKIPCIELEAAEGKSKVLPDVVNNAAVLSGVGYEAVRAIVEHCGWVPLLQRAAQLDVMMQLATAGISRQWDGPPELRGRAVGGEAISAGVLPC